MSMKIRPGYKKTELGIFPEDWELFCLSELAELTSSKRIFENDYVPTGVPFYRGKEISLLVSQKTIEDPQFISDKKFNEIKQKFGAPEAGDILITAVGTLGNIYVVNNNIPFYFKDGNLIWLRKINSSDSNYIGAQLEKNKSKILDGAIGSSQKALTIVVLKKLQIPVAPLLEQRAIAGALSDMDRLISSLDQLIAKKRDIQQASMQQLLTGQRRLPGFRGEWTVKRLGDVANLYQPVTISARQLTNSGYPVYGANGVVGFFSEFNHETSQVTVTCRGSTCGTVNRTVEKSWITGNAMVINCDHSKTINKDFLYFLLLGQDLSVCITGTGQPQIVRSPLANFELPIPSDLKEQTAITTILSDMDTDLAALEARRNKARQLKQGMMQELLTGRIRLA